MRGCTKISPGCLHCYAETFAERFRGVPGHPFEQGFDLRLVPEKLGLHPQASRRGADGHAPEKQRPDRHHERRDQGTSVAEVLEPSRKVLPHSFLPVIRAGEAAGRRVEAFQLLHQHCHRIAPSMRLVRNAWLYPLVCIVFGWIIRIGVFLCFGKSAAAWHFCWYSFGVSALLVLAGWLLMRLRAAKAGVDLAPLQVPVLREVELGLGTVLFFGTFRLAYEAGGLGVVPMFDLASQTVRNSAIRQELVKARRILDQNGTFAEAFGQLTMLEDRFKGLVATGSVTGQLDPSLAQHVASVTQ